MVAGSIPAGGCWCWCLACVSGMSDGVPLPAGYLCLVCVAVRCCCFVAAEHQSSCHVQFATLQPLSDAMPAQPILPTFSHLLEPDTSTQNGHANTIPTL